MATLWKNAVVVVGLTWLNVQPAAAEEKKPPPSKLERAGKIAVKEARDSLKEGMVNAQVRSALLKNLKGADGARIHIEVEGHTVTLTGQVKERASMKLCGEVARSVEGVGQVHNKVALTPDSAAQDGLEARMKDQLLESEVKMRLLRDVGQDGLRVELEAADGVVSVRGKLAAADKKEPILKSVRATPGVVDVKDLLSAP
jgi:hyperosmotically inducible protein